MLEKELYPAVERFARKTLGCGTTRIDTGLKAGRIDVVGLRHIGAALDGSGEAIGIEVKRGRQPFLSAAGQAASYSAYVDRSYLADWRDDGFSRDERMIAEALGIGLLTISGNRRLRVTEVQSAPTRNPVPALRLELIEKLHMSICTICNGFFKRGERHKFRKNVVGESSVDFRARAVAEERGLMYWLREQDDRESSEDRYYFRRYICADCTKALFG